MAAKNIDQATHHTLLQSTATIVAGMLQASQDGTLELQSLLNSVYNEVAKLEAETRPNVQSATGRKPSISIEDSVQPNYLICMEDGKQLKMLKRYLKTNYNMTPEEYRKRWDLPATYPMVAPEYAKRRSQLAKDIGLGRDNARIQRSITSGKARGLTGSTPPVSAKT